MSTRSFVLPFFTTALLFVSACANSDTMRTAATHTTGAVLSLDDAAVQLAQARCERNAECNNLAGQAFSDRHDCADAVHAAEQRNLKEAACSLGVDAPQIDKCVAVLRDEMCLGNPGPLESLPECGAKRLCAH